MKLVILVAASVTVLLFAGCGSAPDKKLNSETAVSGENDQEQELNSFTIVNESLWFQELVSPEQRDGDSTRFEVVRDCGVDFTNILLRKNHLKFIETGSGVALADYDDDGQTDIYLLSTDGPNKLYRGLGGFKFEDVTSQAGGLEGAVNGKDAWATGATFADIENDGDLDLFVCNAAAQNLLYINNGDGSFSEKTSEAGLHYVGASKVGSFCDYDHDGDLDLYLLTYQDFQPTGKAKLRLIDGEPTVHPDYQDSYQIMNGKMVHAGEADVLYRNNGNGTFTDVTAGSGISGYDLGLSVTWFDFNSDGWQDVYIGNDFKTPDHLYQNNGDGTFIDVLPKVVHHTPWFSMGADSGDLNNDGLVDMMIADMSGTTHYKQKVGMGDMSVSSWFLTYGEPRQYMRNSLYINTGTGRFLEAAFQAGLDSTNWTWSVRFADLNNDGMLDIFVTNGHARNSGDSDLEVKLAELRKSVPQNEVEELGKNIPILKEENLVFKNNGDFSFESVGSKWGLNLNGVSHGAAFADFDRDGDLDIVVNNLNDKATVYRNLSTEGKRLIVELCGNTSNRRGIGATVEIWQGDGYQQRSLASVRGYISSDEPVVHFGLTENNIDRLVVTWPGGRKQEFSDLTGNRRYRILEDDSKPIRLDSSKPDPARLFHETAVKTGLKFNHQENDFDDYKREPLLPYQLSRLGPGIAWGDINNDGFPDVFVGGAANQEGCLFVNRKGKLFEPVSGPWQQDKPREDMGCLFFDADSDGDQDLFVASGSNEYLQGSKQLFNRLYINTGNESYQAAGKDVIPSVGNSSSCVVANDFDRDGDLDLFVGSRSVPGKYPLSPTSQLLKNDDGRFTSVTSELAVELENIGMVNSAIWSDYDGDGWNDLIVALDWGPVSVFKNNEGKLENVTKSLGLAELTGWWHGLAAGDLDNDGDIDYVATNHGHNTKYHTDTTHPHRLYYYDFDDSGTLDLVEAEFEGEVEYPVRGRSCSSRCMPFIADKFESFHEFAIAPLDDIYDQEVHERPFLEVTTLDSVVIWNQGNEGFRISKLPWMAQLSPGYGVDCVDANSDGMLDILIAQNFFGSQPETGYMDGGVGVLLAGDGTGEFEIIWPAESGVILPDDSTGLATADFDRDGDIDVLVAANDGSVRLLENQLPVGTSQVLKIVGPVGNRAAIGSRVSLSFGDNMHRTFEVSAGSSYLSQSETSRIFLSSDQFESIESISVRWPDGEQSTVKPDGGSTEIEIQYPGDVRESAGVSAR